MIDNKISHEDYKKKIKSVKNAINRIKRGDRIFIGSGCAEPQLLTSTLVEESTYLEDNEVLHTMTLGVAAYTEPTCTDKFRHNAFFIGPNVRGAVNEGRADYTPIFVSEIPKLIEDGLIPIDVALIQITPPDEHGYCSLGVSVDIVKSVVEHADLVIAEMNPQMPRTMGESFVSVDEIDVIVENDAPIPEFIDPHPDEVAEAIGINVSDLVEDGSTLQIGLGTAPYSALKYLKDKKDLGVHTDMFSDWIIDLIDEEVITNQRKSINHGKVVASFCMGSKKLYYYIDNNPFFEFYPSQYTNDPFIISQNEKMVVINSAIEVDLTGQVCMDSIGYQFYSGIGGRVDFIRGAARSKGGKSIVALPSTAENGMVSRIVTHLREGADVTATRGDVYYVVTEYGVAYLHGKSIRERALALISIAHPKFREELLKQAKEKKFVYQDQVLPTVTRYPKEWEMYKTLKEGEKVFFRPIKATDESMLRNLFYLLSDETVYLRFFGPLKSFPHYRMQRFVNVDYIERMAIVGTLRNGEKEDIIAVGSYNVDEKTNMAEVAFVIHDDWQNKGIGTFILDYLIKIAKENGIAGFTANVLGTNRRMLHVFHKTGYNIDSKFDYGNYEISFRF
ncbi:MAG: GNAT family N-acetyltransferase [Halobacteriota archaeon]|nr:GNAT family N-acetyltransferase [Halobacteriota archaeon]